MTLVIITIVSVFFTLFYASTSQAGGSYSYYTPTKAIMNPIDSCWRGRPDWAQNRQSLADCAIGFGSDAIGGKLGPIYVVTDTSDDPINPKPGTLRYGVVQTEPLWIIFDRDMSLVLNNELIMNSYKTIDGRGVNVEISNGPCITIQGISHVIIHGIRVHHCKPSKPGIVRSSLEHVGHRLGADGDSIAIYGSSHVWVDHCFFSSGADGLVDVTHASTAVTVSNNYFTTHDKVMLLGHNDGFTADKIMRVTVAFNLFGPGLIERMPRVRIGYAHVANNRYEEWEMYAIGGSANPTIFSQGNYFAASNNPVNKQVTKREVLSSGWKNWKWRSSGDVFNNGAFFVQSGWGTCMPAYTSGQSFTVSPGSLVPALTAGAGPLNCVVGRPC